MTADTFAHDLQRFQVVLDSVSVVFPGCCIKINHECLLRFREDGACVCGARSQIDLGAQKPITRHGNEWILQAEHRVLFQELHGNYVAWMCASLTTCKDNDTDKNDGHSQTNTMLIYALAQADQRVEEEKIRITDAHPCACGPVGGSNGGAVTKKPS